MRQNELRRDPRHRGAALGGAREYHALRAAGGLAIALALAGLTLSRAPREAGQNLEPRSDALEYAVLARRLADGDPPTLPIGEHAYPSRYPVGFPLLLLPAAAFGVAPDHLYVVTAIISLVGIATVYEATRRLTNIAAATWAASLLALAPLQLQCGLMTMSDGPAAAASALWALVLVSHAPPQLLGLVAGYACSMRIGALPLLAGTGLAALSRGRAATVRAALGAAVGLAPSIATFAGGWSRPLAGYAFWRPEIFGTPANAFGLRYVTHNLSVYGPALLGVGRRPALYPLFIPLLLVFVFFGRQQGKRRIDLAIVMGTALLTCLLMIPYYYCDLRLIVTTLPLIVLSATVGLEAVRERDRRVAWIVAILTLGLQLLVARHLLRGERFPSRMATVMHRLAGAIPPSALVVSDVPSLVAWLYWTRGTEREFMPLLVPPDGLKGDFVDRHVRGLYAMGGEAAGGLPSVLLDRGMVTAAGAAAIARHREAGSAVVLIACTSYGKALFDKASGALSGARRWRIDPCELAGAP